MLDFSPPTPEHRRCPVPVEPIHRRSSIGIHSVPCTVRDSDGDCELDCAAEHQRSAAQHHSSSMPTADRAVPSYRGGAWCPAPVVTALYLSHHPQDAESAATAPGTSLPRWDSAAAVTPLPATAPSRGGTLAAASATCAARRLPV